MTTYATFSEFTQVYSINGVSQDEINNVWLPYGARRINEELGAAFTIPFSSNNETAKQLSIEFGYLGILLRTRDQNDSQEMREDLMDRIADIACHGKPMILTDGTGINPSKLTQAQFWSNTQDYKSVFDMRNASEQRVDPDQLNDLWAEDY